MDTTYIEACDIATYVADFNTGEVLMINEAACRLLRREQSELIGNKCWTFCDHERETYCSFCPREHLLDGANNPVGPYSWKCYNETLRTWLNCTNQAGYWPDGRLVQTVTMADMGSASAEECEWNAANVGDVSGLIECVKSLSESGDTEQCGDLVDEQRVELICIDLSDLRLIHTAYSWDIGRLLLKTIIEWVAGLDFNGGSLYHVDGYTFCLVIRDADADTPMRIARGLKTRFANPWTLPDCTLETPFYCSVKMAVVHVANNDLVDSGLVDMVNRAIRLANRHNDIFIHDAEADLHEHRQLRLEASLKTCVNDGMHCFHVEYQPIVHLSSGKWTGLEALCRWNSPEFGPIPPATFIPSAERQGLITDIGLWVLEQAVRDVKKIGLDRIDDFFLSVNVSPLQLLDADFPDKLSTILRRHRYPCKKLLLEITESAEVALTGGAQAIIELMSWIDVRMALDDFGTGYASFNNLKRLPVHFLKTECEFIRNIESDDSIRYFFFVMTELSHANKAKLIAEGVETMGELRAIRDSGADYGQGFLFGKPMRREELEARLDGFYHESRCFSQLSPEPSCKTNWLDGTEIYGAASKILKTLNQVIHELLSDKPIDESFVSVLRMLGEHLGLDRAFVHIYDSDRFATDFDWRRPGMSPAVVPDAAEAWDYVLTDGQLDEFRFNGMIVIDDAAVLDDNMLGIMCPSRHRAIALMPMWDGDMLVGVVGFECFEPGPWPQEALIILKDFSLVSRSVLIGERLKERMRDTAGRFRAVNGSA